MQKIIELENPNYVSTNILYYKGKIKKDFLSAKKKTIKKIDKDNILGFGYDRYSDTVYSGGSMEDIDYPEHIYEYMFISGGEDILFLPLSSICFNDSKTTDKYAAELENLGYTKLPVGFRNLGAEKLTEHINRVK